MVANNNSFDIAPQKSWLLLNWLVKQSKEQLKTGVRLHKTTTNRETTINGRETNMRKFSQLDIIRSLLVSHTLKEPKLCKKIGSMRLCGNTRLWGASMWSLWEGRAMCGLGFKEFNKTASLSIAPVCVRVCECACVCDCRIAASK